jgi:predicted XRE-type DNA-binding protein
MKNGKLKAKKRIRFERSCGNVFRDLGFENPELLLVKSTLIVEIHRTIEERNMTDAAAADVLGIAPAEVDSLLRGDVEDRYSIRQLASILHTLGESDSSHGTAKGTGNAKLRR